MSKSKDEVVETTSETEMAEIGDENNDEDNKNRINTTEYDDMARELEENKKKMRETLGYSLDEFNLNDTLKPSVNFAEELMRLIETNLEPFESDHYFGRQIYIYISTKYRLFFSFWMLLK